MVLWWWRRELLWHLLFLCALCCSPTGSATRNDLVTNGRAQGHVITHSSGLTSFVTGSRVPWLSGCRADTSLLAYSARRGRETNGSNRLVKVALGDKSGNLKCIKHLCNDKLEWNLSALLEVLDVDVCICRKCVVQSVQSSIENNSLNSGGDFSRKNCESLQKSHLELNMDWPRLWCRTLKASLALWLLYGFLNEHTCNCWLWIELKTLFFLSFSFTLKSEP